MISNHSVDFFDRQFRQQSANRDLGLNPFENAALPYLTGHVLDFGCGMGNLAVAAAQRGCTLVALDASAAAIAHLQARAKAESLAIEAMVADLRQFNVSGTFDTIIVIGLLMFFDCPTALRCLADLQTHVRAGGHMIVNVLVDGTTYREMFAEEEYCLFKRGEIAQCFAGWNIVCDDYRNFDAPGNRIKAFNTVIAQQV